MKTTKTRKRSPIRAFFNRSNIFHFASEEENHHHQQQQHQHRRCRAHCHYCQRTSASLISHCNFLTHCKVNHLHHCVYTKLIFTDLGWSHFDMILIIIIDNIVDYAIENETKDYQLIMYILQLDEKSRHMYINLCQQVGKKMSESQLNQCQRMLSLSLYRKQIRTECICFRNQELDH